MRRLLRRALDDLRWIVVYRLLSLAMDIAPNGVEALDLVVVLNGWVKRGRGQ